MPSREGVKLKSSRYSKRYELRVLPTALDNGRRSLHNLLAGVVRRVVSALRSRS